MEKPPTFRIPLRTLKNKKKPKKEDLCRMLYGGVKVALVRLIDIPGGFIAICQSSADVETITSSRVAVELQRLGLEAKVPPQINAKRSVICRRIDPWIGQHTKEEIKEEIESKQDWLRNNISEVVKFGDHAHIFKLVLNSVDLADKVKCKGILMFNMVVTPEQMEAEVFIDVTTCFSCYALEEHLQKDCPHKERKICSECAEEGHVWRDCQSSVKKCINCGGGHRTMSMGCMAKKNIIKKKKEEMEQRKEKKANQTYVDVARAVARENTQDRPVLSLPKHPSTKLLTCILYAHVANIGSPGSFAAELNGMLKSNGMQNEDMVFPANPPSQQILGVQFTDVIDPVRDEPAAQAAGTSKNEVKEKKRPRQSISPKLTERRKKRLQEGELSYESTDVETEEEEAPQPTPIVQRMVSDLELKEPKSTTKLEPVYDAKDINLRVFTSSNNPFPKTLSKQCIADGIRMGTYKYEYDTNISEAEVRQALLSGRVRMSSNHCINAGPQERFVKIKSGRRQPSSHSAKQDKKHGP